MSISDSKCASDGYVHQSVKSSATLYKKQTKKILQLHKVQTTIVVLRL